MASLRKDPYHTRPCDEAEENPYTQDEADQAQAAQRRSRFSKMAEAALEILGDALEFVFEVVFDNLS